MSKNTLLEQINNPADLRNLKPEELTLLADELRQFLIHSIADTGGHFAASLGTVELTIALHYVFNTPDDQIVWDVGHQCYGHKVLTGRRERMPTLRQWQGLTGFPKRSESCYDTFDVGHASTSISAALGMSIANKLNKSKRKTIAVIGDGALTAGMAFEALNHAGDINANMLVILNDNAMSISKNVGGLSKYLVKLIAGKFYLSIRRSGKRVLKRMPLLLDFAQRWEEHMKGMVLPGTLFEELGFNYIGPVDGHNLPELIKFLSTMRKLKGPQFLHIITKKGKGYEPAERNPSAFHGVPKFNLITGSLKKTGAKSQSYTDVFSEWICQTAKKNKKLIAITPAMREGSGLVQFSQSFPKRFFDVGIAEQHAVTLAAGMATQNLQPVVAIYSTFMQRAYDQVIHDVALQNLPILFAIDRAGLVGPDGATHAGNYDISYLRCVPNFIIMAPANASELTQMLELGLNLNQPVAVRYPRDTVPQQISEAESASVEFTKGKIVEHGNSIAILAFGPLLHKVKSVARRLNATLVSMRFIKPLDENLLLTLSTNHNLFITLEENSVNGGAGSAVSEFLHKQGLDIPQLLLGLPDQIIEQGTRDELLKEAGLDEKGIEQAIQIFLKRNCNQATTQVIS